jgi:hypothetical protein
MYKNLSIVALLVAFGLVAARSTGLPASPPPPVIVAKQRLVNQTAPIPATTIFTPAHDGVYRLSVYATLTKSDPSSQAYWSFVADWTDDAGSEYFNGGVYYIFGNYPPQQFLNYNSQGPLGGLVVTIEAKAGTPVTFAMSQPGGPDNSAYSLYYTLEKIE